MMEIKGLIFYHIHRYMCNKISINLLCWLKLFRITWISLPTTIKQLVESFEFKQFLQNNKNSQHKTLTSLCISTATPFFSCKSSSCLFTISFFLLIDESTVFFLLLQYENAIRVFCVFLKTCWILISNPNSTFRLDKWFGAFRICSWVRKILGCYLQFSFLIKRM